MRLALCAALVTSPAWAGDYPSSVEPRASKHRLYDFFVSDRITLKEIRPGEGVVEYYNHREGASVEGAWTLGDGNIVVDVEISYSDSFEEILSVRPRGGYVATPEQVFVLDGDTASVSVVLSMF